RNRIDAREMDGEGGRANWNAQVSRDIQLPVVAQAASSYLLRVKEFAVSANLQAIARGSAFADNAQSHLRRELGKLLLALLAAYLDALRARSQ
ncbi:MAG: hypothetical protein ABIV11_09215, partial [Gemmatimonadaceae bacterium]